MIRQSLILLSFLFFFFLTTGCHPDSAEISPFYNEYTFDKNTIDKLPIYDSLVSAILEKSSFFEQHINEKDSYRAYKYMPASEDADVSKKLPKEIGSRINQYYDQLGKNLIYGFDFFKDSTIKVYIRRNQADTHVELIEYLSYYPSGAKMQRREFPVKDTMLNQHWQYWVLFYKARLPF